MWVVLLMVVETEVLTKEIFLEAPDTFTKQHIIHCLYFLFWLSSASVPFGFGGLATRLLGFLSCEWVAVACGDRPDVHHHIHHLTSVVWPSLSGHEVTRWPLLKNKHLMCVLQFFIVGGWHFFNLNKSHFFFFLSSSFLPPLYVNLKAFALKSSRALWWSCAFICSNRWWQLTLLQDFFVPIYWTESLLEIARRFRAFCWNPFKRTPKYLGSSPVNLPLFEDRTAVPLLYVWELLNYILQYTDKNLFLVSSTENQGKNKQVNKMRRWGGAKKRKHNRGKKAAGYIDPTDLE